MPSLDKLKESLKSYKYRLKEGSDSYDEYYNRMANGVTYYTPGSRDYFPDASFGPVQDYPQSGPTSEYLGMGVILSLADDITSMVRMHIKDTCIVSGIGVGHVEFLTSTGLNSFRTLFTFESMAMDNLSCAKHIIQFYESKCILDRRMGGVVPYMEYRHAEAIPEDTEGYQSIHVINAFS